MKLLNFLKRETKEKTFRLEHRQVGQSGGASFFDVPYFNQIRGNFQTPSREVDGLSIATSCIDKIANGIIKLGDLQVLKDGEPYDHELNNVLKTPNDLQDPDFFYLYNIKVLLGWGQTFIKIVSKGGEVKELLSTYSGSIFAYPTQTHKSLMSDYYYRDVDGKVWNKEDYIQLRDIFSYGLHNSQSRLAYCRRTTQTAIATNETRGSLVENGGRFAGLIRGLPTTKSEDRKNIVQSINKYQSTITNKGGYLTLPADMSIEALQFSQKDQEFLEQCKLSNEEIARLFSMPLSALSVVAATSYGSSAEDNRSVFKNAILPVANRVSSAFTFSLLTKKERQEGLKIGYYTRDLDTFSPNEKANYYTLLIQNGVLTPEQVAKAENYEYKQSEMVLQGNSNRVGEGEAD